MDIFDITYKEVNRDNLGEMVKSGQRVTITRIVTIVYEVDISEILDGSDETEISLKQVIEDEADNPVNSVNLEFSGEVDIEDTTVIAVEIA